MRLGKFGCNRISFKELKRKLNYFWQLSSLFGVLILRRVECRFERLCYAKDEKVIVIRTAWNIAIHCDETYEVKSQVVPQSHCLLSFEI